MRRIISNLLPLILLLTLTISACDSNGANGPDTARVTLNAAATSPFAPKAAKTSSDHVDITEVKILLKSITFHTEDEVIEGEGEEPPVDGDEEEDGTFRLAPVVITLIPGVDPVPVDVGDLPIEEYDRVSFHIHKPRGNETPLDPDFAGDTPSERYSIVVYGNPPESPEGPAVILYRSTQNVVHVVDFDPPFIPGADDLSEVTLEALLSQWFVDTDGTDLDPADTTQQNRSRIDRSIRNSFRIFQDDDADGVEDGGENG